MKGGLESVKKKRVGARKEKAQRKEGVKGAEKRMSERGATERLLRSIIFSLAQNTPEE